MNIQKNDKWYSYHLGLKHLSIKKSFCKLFLCSLNFKYASTPFHGAEITWPKTSQFSSKQPSWRQHRAMYNLCGNVYTTHCICHSDYYFFSLHLNALSPEDFSTKENFKPAKRHWRVLSEMWRKPYAKLHHINCKQHCQ